MSVPTAETTPGRPSPVADERNAPYWSHAARGEYALPRCAQCRAWAAPPVANCSNCLHDQFDWEIASGEGTVYSYIEYRRAWTPAWADQVPYLVGVVQLAEGPRLIVGLDYDSDGRPPSVDGPVQVRFDLRADGTAVPVFGVA